MIEVNKKMKRQIRKGVWETNSSSVNTLTIMNKKEFKDWEARWDDPDWAWDWENEVWINKNESEEYKEYPDEFWENPCGDYYEIETTEYTTEHGDEVVAISIYGFDG